MRGNLHARPEPVPESQLDLRPLGLPLCPTDSPILASPERAVLAQGRPSLGDVSVLGLPGTPGA